MTFLEDSLSCLLLRNNSIVQCCGRQKARNAGNGVGWFSDIRLYAACCLVSVIKLVHELSAFLDRFSQASNMFRTFDTDDEGRHAAMQVTEIWRYPVKTMAGEKLQRIRIGPL